MSTAIQLDPLEIVLGHNFPVAITATKPSQGAGDRFREVPDTGLSLTAFLSLARGPTATAIHANVSIALPEIAATAAYYNEFAGANLTAHLTAYADTSTPIYLVVSDGTTIRASAECRVVSAGQLQVPAG